MNAVQQLAVTFNRPLKDVGTLGDARFAGIYSPVYDAEEVKRYMSSYYESDAGAEGQDAKFNLNDYYGALLREALERTGGVSTAGEAPLILEVGCGFGSATFPLLDIYPQAQLIASEFSLSMLRVLRNKLAAGTQSERCALLQLNAEDMDFKPGSFDLVVGAAILHHLFQPEKVIESCARLLKPGGRAIFFEPFESGLDIIGLIYADLLRNPRLYLMNPRRARYVWHSLNYWRQMRGADKNAPFFQGADDKWLFTPTYFEKLRERFGFRSCIQFPLDKSSRPFASLVKTHMEGNGFKPIPGWVWKTVDRYESAFSDEMKQSLFTEGGIVFQK
jgi:ubiquinone/menaquinone biosynthesis C-methylase UbiE